MNKCDLCQNKTYCADSRSAKESCKANYYEAFSPCSNADRIRAMTDEELAEWIAQILTYHNVKMYVACEKACPLYKCCNDQPSDNIEDWLKSPVEVDNG